MNYVCGYIIILNVIFNNKIMFLFRLLKGILFQSKRVRISPLQNFSSSKKIHYNLDIQKSDNSVCTHSFLEKFALLLSVYLEDF